MEKLIQRNAYLERIIERKENGSIKIITGIRRCGKSYLLFYLYHDYLIEQGVPEEQIIQIALDDIEFEKYRDPDALNKYIRSKIVNKDMYYIFIDEVQYAISKDELQNPENVRLYNVLNGIMRLRNTDIYVTGSNSKLLSRDVMTAFRGRGDRIHISPLSFKEYYNYIGGDKNEVYEEYALYGGMPELLKRKSDSAKTRYLEDLFTSVYFKDIIERYDLQKDDVLRELTDDLCSSVGSLTNAKKISDTLRSVKNVNVTQDTIKKYIDCLIESFLFSEAKRYDVKGKKYFQYPNKYYCVDVGLRNARLNFRQQEETHIMENIIYNELICREYSVDVGVVDIAETKDGKRTKKQCEIDFVVNRGSKKYYIQSALSVSDPDKMATELRPLKSTNDFFKKIIISKTNQKPWTDDDGILHIGLIDFLLNENAIDM